MTQHEPVIRPMTVDDLPGVIASSRAALLDLSLRLTGHATLPSPNARRRRTGDAIVRQLLALDAGGAWVAVSPDTGNGGTRSGATGNDGTVVGASMAGVREGLWYLAQLHLDPTFQGRGIGRRLLDAALGYGQETNGMLLHSSLDPRAMRCYERAGFTLRPAWTATGRMRRDRVPPVNGVRSGGVEDLDLVADVDRAQRGGAHGPDLELLLRLGARLFIVADRARRGYALVQDEPLLVAATDVPTAEALLWTALAESAESAGSAEAAESGESPESRESETTVGVLPDDQRWAVEVAVRAGLELKPTGPLCQRGETGALAPYLPHPALL